MCLHFLAPLSCHLALLLEDLCALLSLGLVLTPFFLDTGSGDLGSPHMCQKPCALSQRLPPWGLGFFLCKVGVWI